MTTELPTQPATEHSEPRGRGATVWLTGLPSAGKTTIANALADRLRREGHRVEVLDGDELRRNLTADLGYGREDRNTNVRRVGYVAELLARNGIKAIVPVIAPYAESRRAVRARHEAARAPYVEVHVSTPLDVCSDRDVKGLYAKQREGQISGLTGVDDPYEVPESPELRLDAHEQTLTQSVESVHAALAARDLA
ncbi:MAG: adenylyl-sulfate kinase [Carbonactinosporaceae bacterium]